MGSRSLLRENDLNGFAEGLALSDTSQQTDLGQKLSHTGTLSYFSLYKVFFFKVLTGPFTIVMDGRWHP
jgi:hypothetical protein